MFWTDLKLRLRSFVLRRRAGEELDEELDFHLAMQERKNAAAGVNGAESKRLARLQFGGISTAREESRDIRGIQFVESIWQDLRYGWRGLMRSPIFAFTVVVTIALGLGVNIAVFTIFDANYLRPLHVRNASSLYELYWVDRAGGAHNFSWRRYQEFVSQNSAFSEALAFQRTDARVEGRSAAITLVSGNFFTMLGANAALGRILLPRDAMVAGDAPVAVLAYSFWQSAFGGDASVLGKTILLHGHRFEIVGISAPDFSGLGARPTDLWAPVTMASVFGPDNDLFGAAQPESLEIVGSLRSEITLRQAEAGIAVWARHFTSDLPAGEQAMGATAISRATRMPFNPRNAALFSLVIAAFAAILLIACTNVMNMMLARAISRQREIGVRLSLGASRERVVRQLLTEGLLIVAPAAALGVLFSQGILRAGTRVLATTLPPGIAGFLGKVPVLTPDARVLTFSIFAALLATVSCGILPALQATRADLSQVARGEFAHGWRPSRVRNLLLAGQVVVCLLLLITAGVVLRGIHGLQLVGATLSSRDTIELGVREDARTMALERFSREPAIETLAAASSAPVDRKASARIMATSGQILTCSANRVSPEYFALFEIPVLRGRNFTAEEARSAAPVVILSQSAAEEIWPGQEAVGKPLDWLAGQNSANESSSRRLTVIGIVRDEPSRWIASGESKAIAYTPTNPRAAGALFLLGVHGEAEPVMHRLDADFDATSPNAIERLQLVQIRRWVDEEAYSFRVIYWVASALGLLALLLTLSGIYGVVSYIVSQRTKEIGIRMALGASPQSVARLIAVESMRIAIAGGLIGCALAFAAARILASSLLMIHTFDVAAFGGGVLFVWATCAAAAYAPARTAARVDPIATLRYD
jgi:predicted permease